jgi:20S proteasome alpha/beta subunit
MTTIAYKNGVIAYDSRTTANDLITNDNANKKHVINDVTFFMCGAVSDYKRFFALYFEELCSHKNIDASALVVDNGQLYLVSVEDEAGIWRQPMNLDNPCALGSGNTFALTAMDMGADAKTAVEMAIKRDCKSGGMVHTYEF